MATRLSLLLTQEEASLLLGQLKKNLVKGKVEKLYDSIARSYLQKMRMPAKKVISFALAAKVANPEVLRLIIHVLSVLTGFPEDEITLTSTLAGLLMTPTKKEQLRKSINKYIHDHGSSKFITAAEMGGLKTVQDVYDLTIKKL